MAFSKKARIASQTPEARKKRGESRKRYYAEHPEERERVIRQNKERWSDPEYKKRVSKKISLVSKRRCRDSNERNRLANQVRSAWKRNRQKYIDAFRKGHSSKETREKHSANSKRLWADPSYRKKWKATRMRRVNHDPVWKENIVRAARKSYLAAMTKAGKGLINTKEAILISALDKMYPGEWKYVGDWSLVIGGKCPDFANVNGQKKLIELFGDYWHRNDDPQDRINYFKQFGYETLVIWERELQDANLPEKLSAFCSV